MPPPASPLLGYNTNVRHKGKVFHVQTEDSGARYAHVVTHLFVDGGRILDTLRNSYSEHLAAEGRSEIVRDLMKRQHKAMLLALRSGRFDALADAGGPRAASVPAISGTASSSLGSGSIAAVSGPRAPAPGGGNAVVSPPASPAAAPPGTEARRRVPTRPASAFAGARPQGKSVFGEDPRSDGSLDSVILSYLAFDGDPDRKS